MFRVVREIEFCYGHRLLDYEGKCRYLHGHNARALVTLEGAELDHRGMLLDFGEIKRRLSQWIDDNLDHRLILHQADPAAALLQQAGETLYLLDANPTAENIARLIYQQAQQLHLPVVEVALWETPHCQAVFRPASGRAPISDSTSARIHGQLILPRNPGPVKARTDG
ncbi:MAG TPA: 6-carboxytetrahydropterin synthase [Thermoguttaceae bacterium]|jgi:6-pyruvoyltetrahydropterin/6-carboxytetrahydropterin synthase|nr:6-carboxytetrahydropterin synthase [Thermoguttaceae bacterium]